MSDGREQELLSDVEIARQRVERYRRGRAWIVTGGVFASWLLIGGITLGMVTNAVGVDLGAGPGGLIVVGFLGLLSTAGIAMPRWWMSNSETITIPNGRYPKREASVSAFERYEQAQKRYRDYITTR